jgi:tungstate transport system substrate-binding protein
MKAKIVSIFLLGILGGCGPKPEAQPKPVIRVAVIGGMVMTGLWQQLSEQFQRDTGYSIELVVTGPKEVIGPAFRQGRIDLLTMHSSDEATALVAEGLALNLRPWTWNEHVIVGPADDPAGIRGLKSGAEALRKIVHSRSNFIDAQGGGKRLIAEKLWTQAGLRPRGEWLLKDESTSPTALLSFAEQKHAYAICGRIPILWNKIPKGSLKIMVEGDSEMRRPFVVIEANPAHFPAVNTVGARRLSDYLVGREGQLFLSKFHPDPSGLFPAFYPMGQPTLNP